MTDIGMPAAPHVDWTPRGGVATRPGWRMLAEFVRQRRRATAVVLGWSAAEALPALCSGLLVAAAVDRGFLAGQPLVGFGWLGLLGLVMTARAAISRGLVARLGAIVEPLRDELVTAVVSGTLRGAVARPVRPDAASVARLGSQVESVRSLVSALLRSARQLGLSLVMALIGLVSLAPEVALLVVVPLVAALAACVPLLRALGRRQRVALLAEERVAQAAGAVFDGLRDVAACGARGPTERRLGALVDASQRASRAAARAGAVTTFVVAVGSRLPVLAVLVATPWLLADRGLTSGALIGAVAYVVTGIEPALRSMVAVLGSWGVQLNTVLRRLGETSGPPPTAIGSGEVPTGTDLAVTGVTFRYGPHARPVFEDLTLTVPAGQHLAVVGPSGIGKSTLADLVAGLTRPDHGTITIGDTPLGAVDETWLRRNIVLIPQQAYVFTGTVRENLAYLCPVPPGDPELRAAMLAVGAGPLLDRLGGLDAGLGVAGPDLSAGESQLVALARALLSPARIVILDEGTCHLDPETEARAELAFAARRGTLVVIAHRISSALRAQRILVIDGDGTVTGSHAELLTTSPRYADLVGHWDANMGTSSLCSAEDLVAAYEP